MTHVFRKLEEDSAQIEEWFEHMHKNPELSMKEEQTAKYIENLVRSWGYEVETGIGKYGIVASLSSGTSEKAIGLRADFDALPIQEVNDLNYISHKKGVSHLCGHDGHTSMLL